MPHILKKIGENVFIYIFAFILVFVSLSLVGSVNNKYLLTVILSFFILVFYFIISKFKNAEDFIPEDNSGRIRYSMICKNCHWEWMSNTTSKKMPTKCPNCGEKKLLETIGWRRVKTYQDKTNEDLNKYFRA